jgi:hypothetical protein
MNTMEETPVQWTVKKHTSDAEDACPINSTDSLLERPPLHPRRRSLPSTGCMPSLHVVAPLYRPLDRRPPSPWKHQAHVGVHSKTNLINCQAHHQLLEGYLEMRDLWSLNAADVTMNFLIKTNDLLLYCESQSNNCPKGSLMSLDRSGIKRNGKRSINVSACGAYAHSLCRKVDK